MKISCIHCGLAFSITADQLGKRGKCPHCRAQITLPKSYKQSLYKAEQLAPPNRYLENMLCGFSTVILHLLVLIVFALTPWGEFSDGQGGEGEQILIGQLAREQLVENPTEKLQPLEVDSLRDFEPIDAIYDETFTPTVDNPVAQTELDMTIPTLAGGAQRALEIQSINDANLLAGGVEEFGKMISRLKRDGLDIVLTFDSTGSMQGEINVVKEKIERIGGVLLEMIPKTRISICTYRDNGDAYVVKGLPLTDNLAKVKLYLDQIQAAGGGDEPEAVYQGLQWSIENNKFRPRARKVILLFGDAPPHASEYVMCQKIASDFRKNGGIVSTVTCRSEVVLDEFEAIAKIGGGEAFLTTSERQIMTQLMVLVFGSQHRSKVVEAFDLLKK